MAAMPRLRNRPQPSSRDLAVRRSRPSASEQVPTETALLWGLIGDLLLAQEGPRLQTFAERWRAMSAAPTLASVGSTLTFELDGERWQLHAFAARSDAEAVNVQHGLGLVTAALSLYSGSIAVLPGRSGYRKCVAVQLFRALDDSEAASGSDTAVDATAASSEEPPSPSPSPLPPSPPPLLPGDAP